jgi:solute carrier family 50 (sugar transporter)
VVAANLPGLVLSIWLNMGAAKLQYYERASSSAFKHLLLTNSLRQGGASNTRATLSDSHDASPSSSPLRNRSRNQQQQQQQQQHEEEWNASPLVPEETGDPIERPLDIGTLDDEMREFFVAVPQERALLRVLIAWAVILVYAGWFVPYESGPEPAHVVGLLVNINLVFFYGAPLQTMRQVIHDKSSASIHLPTMFMNYCNTSFWIMYGFTRRDPLIILPNATGLLLGILQGVLCFCYPRHRGLEVDSMSHEAQDLTADDGIMA